MRSATRQRTQGSRHESTLAWRTAATAAARHAAEHRPLKTAAQHQHQATTAIQTKRWGSSNSHTHEIALRLPPCLAMQGSAARRVLPRFRCSPRLTCRRTLAPCQLRVPAEVFFRFFNKVDHILKRPTRAAHIGPVVMLRYVESDLARIIHQICPLKVSLPPSGVCLSVCRFLSLFLFLSRRPQARRSSTRRQGISLPQVYTVSLPQG